MTHKNYPQKRHAKISIKMRLTKMIHKKETHKNFPQKRNSQKCSAENETHKDVQQKRLTKMFHKNETHKNVPQK